MLSIEGGEHEREAEQEGEYQHVDAGGGQTGVERPTRMDLVHPTVGAGVHEKIDDSGDVQTP